MKPLFGPVRAGVAEALVVARAQVPAASRKPPWYGRWLLLWAAVSAVVAAGSVIAQASSVGASDGAAPVGGGWILLAVAAGAGALVLGWRSVATNLARRRLFTEAQPVRRVDILRSANQVVVRPLRRGERALAIPADVFPERATRAASLYGEPVAGGWCAVEIDGVVVLPTGPAEMLHWLEPGSPEWERMFAPMFSGFQDTARRMEQQLELQRRVLRDMPADQRPAMAREIQENEQVLAKLLAAIGYEGDRGGAGRVGEDNQSGRTDTRHL